MFCVIFKIPPNLIGSQYEKLIIQKLNVTLDIISDYLIVIGSHVEPETPCADGSHVLKQVCHFSGLEPQTQACPFLRC